MKKNTRRQGSLMVESIIALSLILVGLLGIINLIIKSESVNKNVRNQFIASYLAAEGIEVIKNIIDTDVSLNKQKISGIVWNSTINQGTYEVQYDTSKNSMVSLGGANSLTKLNFDLSSGIYSYGAGVPSGFTRTIEISGINPITVSSIVRWNENGKEQNIKISDIFTGWRQ